MKNLAGRRLSEKVQEQEEEQTTANVVLVVRPTEGRLQAVFGV